MNPSSALCPTNSAAALPVTRDRAPLKTYISLRDDLWHELVYRPRGCVHRRELATLDLANKVVTLLLTAGVESIMRALELLRCEVCATFIERVDLEIRAARPLPVKIDIPFMRGSLAAALPDNGTIPPPPPSDVPVIPQSAIRNPHFEDDLQPPQL